MIELSRVSVVRGRKSLVRDVDLTFEPAQLTCIVGPNGAGKSTLVRVLGGALTPTQGEVRFFGRALDAMTPNERARRRAVVSQRSQVAFGFTSLEVVLLGRHPHRSSPEGKHDLACAERALARVDARELSGRDVTHLSGGEHQRVELARALAQLSSDVPARETALFLDEPTSNLDPSHQHAALTLARDASREGRLVIAVMHDLNLASQYADRIVMLDDGRVVADGSPRQVLTTELLAQVFGLSTLVLPHPALDCPLIVTTGRRSSSAAFEPPQG